MTPDAPEPRPGGRAAPLPSQPVPPPHSAHTHRVVLLGPQRRPRVGRILTSLGLQDSRVAVITAGWREREAEDHEFAEVTDAEVHNLRLYARMADVWQRDPGFAAADMRRRETLTELDELYLAGLDHAIGAVLTLGARAPRDPAAHAAVLADAENVVRQVDARHLARVQEVHARFWDEQRPHERPAIAEHRHAVAAALVDCSAVLVAGGHVGVLLRALHLFNLAAAVDRPIIAWSAGAMALTDRVVLFNDRAAHGPALAHVYAFGLGLAPGVVAMPAARDRLTLDNHLRMAMLARRFSPASCLLLDDGARVDLEPGAGLPAGSPVLLPDGTHGPFTPPAVGNANGDAADGDEIDVAAGQGVTP